MEAAAGVSASSTQNKKQRRTKHDSTYPSSPQHQFDTQQTCQSAHYTQNQTATQQHPQDQSSTQQPPNVMPQNMAGTQEPPYVMSQNQSGTQQPSLPQNQTGTQQPSYSMPQNIIGTQQSPHVMPHNMSGNQQPPYVMPQNQSGTQQPSYSTQQNMIGTQQLSYMMPQNQSGTQQSPHVMPHNTSGNQQPPYVMPKNQSGTQQPSYSMPQNMIGTQQPSYVMPQNQSGTQQSPHVMPQNMTCTQQPPHVMPQNTTDTQQPQYLLPQNQTGIQQPPYIIPHHSGTPQHPYFWPQNQSGTQQNLMQNQMWSQQQCRLMPHNQEAQHFQMYTSCHNLASMGQNIPGFCNQPFYRNYQSYGNSEANHNQMAPPMNVPQYASMSQGPGPVPPANPMMTQKKNKDSKGEGYNRPAKVAHKDPKIEAPENSKSTLTVFITGIAPPLTEFGLENLVEGKSGGHVTSVIYGEEEGTALFTIEDNPDWSRLKKGCQDQGLRLYTVDEPTMIIVSYDGDINSLDNIQFYFENQKRSGGDDVLSCRQDDNGRVFIEFRSSKVVCRVCEWRRPHVIDGITLTVSPVYSCQSAYIWNSKLHSFPIPKSIQLDDLDSIKKEFLMSESNPIPLVELNKYLSTVYAEFKCTKHGASLTCQLTPKTKNVHKLAKKWKKESVKAFSEYMESNIATTNISVPPKAWNQFKERISTISVDNPSEITIILSSGNHIVNLVGKSKFLPSLTKTMTDIKIEIETEIQRLQQQTSFTMTNMKSPVVRLLHAENVLKKISENYKDMKIEAEAELGIIKLQGVPVDITSVRLEIMNKVMELIEIKHEGISVQQKIVLKRNGVVLYMRAKLDNLSIRAEWEVTHRGLLAYAIHEPDTNTKTLENIMKYSVRESCFPLKATSVAVLKSPKWMTKIDQLNEEEKVRVSGDIQTDNVCIVSTDDIHDDVVSDIRDFIECNSIRVKECFFDQSFLEFLQRHCKNEMEAMRRMQKDDLNIEIVDNVIHIEGTDDRIMKTEDMLNKKKSQFEHLVCKIDRPIQVKLIQSDKGISIVRKVEDENRCIIQGLENWSLEDDVETSDDFSHLGASGGSGNEDSSLFIAKNKTKVYLKKGEIGKEKAEVVVCAVSPDLDFKRGAASKSILHHAGYQIQKCKKDHPDRLEPGELFPVDGGKMKCSEIYLGYIPSWKEEMHKNDKSICIFLRKCMEKAAQNGMTSIAFPAMGTGQLGYPKDEVARLMYKSIEDFDRGNRWSPVKVVNFIVYNTDEEVFNAFMRQKKIFETPGSKKISHGAPFTTPKCGIKVTVAVRELAKEQVDLLCCLSSPRLNLSQGGNTKPLLEVGGPSVQKECSDFISNNCPDGLKEGTLAVVGSGKLPCKKICFGLLPRYHDGKQAAESALEKFVGQCLEFAHKNSMQSVSFVPLGTGYHKYPPDVSAKLMFGAIKKFDSSHNGAFSFKTSVKSINFVLHHKDNSTREAFFAVEKAEKGETAKGWANRKQRRLVKESENLLGREEYTNEFTLGRVHLKTIKGDVTEQPVEAIVRVTKKDLGFEAGAVSKSIKSKTRFADLQAECAKKQGEMATEGVIITFSFGLNCKYIGHVEFQSNLPNWKTIVLKCLEKAEKKGIHSIAFPLFGTGVGSKTFKEEQVAEVFYGAVCTFAQTGGKCLSNIQLVVFDEKMASKVTTVIQKLHAQNKQNPPGTTSAVPGEMAPEVTLDMYSDSLSCLQKAKDMLMQEINRDIVTKPFNDELIRDLKPGAIQAIKRLERKHSVEIDVKQSKSTIHISGTAKNVMQVQDDIHTMFKQFDHGRQVDKMSEMLTGAIQWLFSAEMSDGFKMEEYDKATNLRLETAYMEGKKEVVLESEGGKSYIVNFKTMKEHSAHDWSDAVDVIRRDKIKEATVSLPDHWKPMPDSSNLDVIPLQSSNKEYKQVEKEFIQSVTNGAFKGNISNLQNLKVTGIKRVQNKTLYLQYMARKELLQKQNKKGTQNERNLWHGTMESVIDSINIQGFNRSYCGTANDCWYGNGVYFSPDASYSAQDWVTAKNSTNRHIYKCLVLTGEYTQGVKGMRVPPPKDPNNSNILYDSVVEKMNNPTEFVIFNDTQAYPQYLITFHT
ncbi:hypothetical protein ScPMuIL_000622 [Solemya velum]